LSGRRLPRCGGTTELGFRCRLPAGPEGVCERGHALDLISQRGVVTASRHNAVVTTQDEQSAVQQGDGFRPDGTPDVFNEAMLDRIFESEGEMTPRRRARQEILKKLHADARAKTTVQGYGRHVKSFVDFCNQEGYVPFPANPDVLLQWLGEVALHEDEKTGQAYQTSYVRQMISAVAKWHTSHKLANPANHEVLANVGRGYANTLGRNPKQALPILRKALRLVIDTTFTLSAQTVRNKATHLLNLNDGARFGPRALEAFASWQQVTWPTSDDEPAIVRRVVRGEEQLMTIARHADPHLDAVLALRNWYECSEGADPVFPGPKRHPMTAGAFTRQFKESFAAAGVPEHLPLELISDDDRRRIVDTVIRRTDIQVRDGAMLSLEWFGANRRSEVSDFIWADVTRSPEDPKVLRMVIERSKTDQESAGMTRLIHPQRDPRLDVATHLAEWQKRAEEILGRPVCPSDPIFFRLDQAGHPENGPEPLSPNAVNDRVKLAVAAARLQGYYTSHSLRSGFATQAFLSGYDTAEVQEHLGHADIRSTLIYKRAAVGHGRRNPTRDPSEDMTEREELTAMTVLRRLAEYLENDVGDERVSEIFARFLDEELNEEG
jgi:integrase